MAAPALALVAGCSPFALTGDHRHRSRDERHARGGQHRKRGEGPAHRGAAVVPAAKRWRPGMTQHGLQVYAHNANQKPADAHIERILDYVVARGANSISYSFPLYTERPTADACVHRSGDAHARLSWGTWSKPPGLEVCE